MTSFRLAPMSRVILILTLGMLALPLVFVAGAVFGGPSLAVLAVLIAALYTWVWLRYRPTRFVVRSGELEVVWPLKVRRIRRDDIASVRIIDRKERRREAGWGMRVGVGGLWGGFGWAWTQRRGLVHLYISRTDSYVWIECVSDRPWLITPERPEDFVRALSG